MNQLGQFGEINYKRNFLDEVIVRLDFLQLVTSDKVFNDEVEQAIHEFFPNKGKMQILRFNSVNVKFNAESAEVKQAQGSSEEGNLCEYLAANEKNKLILSNQYLIFEIHEYSNFNELKNWIISVINPFFDNIKVPIDRLGIRYINLFKSEEIKVRKKYFKPEIAATLPANSSVSLDEMGLIRSMHMKEFRNGATKLNFRYGMYNPDYPNELEKVSFALDYDCFTEETIENIDEILSFLEKGHLTIQSLFEESITESLRREMNYE